MSNISTYNKCISHVSKYKFHPTFSYNEDELIKLCDVINDMALNNDLWIDCCGQTISYEYNERFIGAKCIGAYINSKPFKDEYDKIHWSKTTDNINLKIVSTTDMNIAFINAVYGNSLIIVLDENDKFNIRKLTTYDDSYDDQLWDVEGCRI